MTVAAIVVAAGSGERLGAGIPKALVALRGRPLFAWALAAFAEHSEVDVVILVAPEAALASIRAVAEDRALVVTGGDTRQQSVRNGMAALPDDADLVLVHDAARPLVPAEVISSVIAALRHGAEAVIPVVAVTDTIKSVNNAGVISGTVDRVQLRAVQTPQGFHRDVLQQAHSAAVDAGLLDVSDDAGLVERFGRAVHTVLGSPSSFKITTRFDLDLAEGLVSGVTPASR